MLHKKVPFALKVETKISQQDEEQQNFNKSLQAVESKISDLLQGLNTQLEKHHKSLSTTIDEKLNTVTPQTPQIDSSQPNLIKNPVESLAHSILSEQKEKEKRQLNLILHNVKRIIRTRCNKQENG